MEKPHCYGAMTWILKYPKEDIPRSSICDCCYKNKCLEITLNSTNKESGFVKSKTIEKYVEVIRCKRCKYFTNNINDNSLRDGYCNRKEVGCFCKVKDDGSDYCSYAEPM